VTGPTPPLPDLGDLASRISRTRSEFARIYDEVRAQRPHSRPFLVVSMGFDDRTAFERALRQANEEQWFTDLGARLVQDGFLIDGGAVTALHALLRRERGFDDTVQIEKGSMRASNRLCRVEVGVGDNPQAITGTGFLVGPGTVLTSFHVIAGLLDGSVPARDSARRLRMRFDHTTGNSASPEYRVPDEWLLASSPPHPAELPAGATTPRPPSGDVDLTGHLDYAVIAIAGSPGAERGYYELECTVEPKVGDRVHLFQHPMGAQQRHADGEFTTFREASSRQRIDHTANALEGSSGGLLLDGDYNLIGLHQGAHGNPVVNTAISAVAIRDDIRRQGADLLSSRYLQIHRMADGSRPILGRMRCQEWARRPAKSLVRVKSPGDCKGVSFTLSIMQACLPSGDHVIARVQAIELPSDALRTAALLLERLGVSAADLPTEPEASTAHAAWIMRLGSEFVARVAQTHRDRIVWLAIDDLHKSEIPEGGVRDFLFELYRRSVDFTNLRIVLLGLTTTPTGFPTGLVADEDISPPQLEDIVSYVRIQLTAGGVDHTRMEVVRFAKLVEVTIGTEITKLSDFVADKVDRALQFAIEAPA
jgi:hypothetical protein